MLHRLLLVVEVLFLLTFWWQTRINLRELFPDFFTTPLASDYLIPFVYLSDIFLVGVLILWGAGKGFRLQASGFKASITGSWHLTPGVWIMNPVTWLVVMLAVAVGSLVVNQVGWWGWYGWLRLAGVVGLAFYIRDRFRSISVVWWYGAALLLGMACESILLLLEWFRQSSVGLQWLGEWRFGVHTPGIAKIVHDGQEYLRPHGTFAHPNIAGGILSMSLLMAVYWWLALVDAPALRSLRQLKVQVPAVLDACGNKILTWGNDWRVVGVGLVLLLLGLIITFSRTAWIVALAGLVMVGTMAVTARMLRRWGRYAIGILGLLALVAGPLIWSRFDALSSTDQMSIDRRVQLMEVARDLLETSWWKGVGVNNFVMEVAQYGPLFGVGIWREPVHNLYVLIATEIGVVGFAAWMLAWLIIVGRLVWQYRRGENRMASGLLLMIWLQIALLGLFDHYWWTSQQGRLVWWLVLGASMAVVKRSLATTSRQ